MNELDRHNLHSGSRVKYYDQYYNRYCYGEITILRENDAKVIFDGDTDLDYTYYPIDELELVDE